MAKQPQVIETEGECIDDGASEPLEFRNPPAPDLRDLFRKPQAPATPAPPPAPEGGSRAARALRARRGVKLDAAAEQAVAAERTGARVLGAALDFMSDPGQFISEVRKRRDR